MNLRDSLIILLLTAFLLTISMSSHLYSETVTAQATGTFDVPEIFGVEFYTDENVLYNTNIPFSNIDPTKTFVFADGRAAYDGKSDTGVVCLTNLDSVWYLKLHGEPTPPFTLDKISYYMGQPWNRGENKSADGQLAQSPGWYNIPSLPTIIYTAGTLDKINTPYGTLCTFSFAINPRRLYADQSYSCRIIYTLIASP